MHVNNDYQKNSNISHILDNLWHCNKQKKCISRIDIARNLDIYRSTVSNVIQKLIDNEVVLEGESDYSTEKGGRKPVTLSINHEFGCIVGIELQTDIYNVCICSFDGSVLYKNQSKTPECDGKSNEEKFELILETIIDTVNLEVKKTGLPELCIVVAIPGIINTDDGIIIESEPFGLKNYPFPSHLGQKYSLPLLFENDAKCCSWYIKAEQTDKNEQDYLCVLTRNHNNQGISIGMSITINKRVISGHNYAAGEYVSLSWLPSKKSQTGLPQEVLRTVETVEDSYREWAKDLFSTLTPIIPLLEPQTVYLFGQRPNRKELIYDVINKDVIQFKAVTEKFGVKMHIIDKDDSTIAMGAALMFIQKHFEIPSLEENNAYSRFSWDQIFEIQQNQKQKLALQ